MNNVSALTITPKLTKSDRTRAAILAAARNLFAEHGYTGASVRDIAALARIDPAMVIRYFGSKEALFVQAAEIELRLPDLRQIDPAKIGEALVRRFLALWESADGDSGLAVLLRSAASNEFAAAKLREMFARQVAPALAYLGDHEEAATRAGLVASQALGLAYCRYILKLPPVTALSPDQIVARMAPTIQRYLTGDAP